MKGIEKIRIQIGDKVYPEVSVKDLEVERIKRTEHKLKIKNEIRIDASKAKYCGTCKYHNAKVIVDEIECSGVCRLGYGWKSFDQTCKRWRWDGLEKKFEVVL